MKLIRLLKLFLILGSYAVASLTIRCGKTKNTSDMEIGVSASPAAGARTEATKVTLMVGLKPVDDGKDIDQVDLVTFYYTTDGTDPNTSSKSILADLTKTVEYTNATVAYAATSTIDFSSTTVLKYFAVASYVHTENKKQMGVMNKKSKKELTLSSEIVTSSYTFSASSSSSGSSSGSSSSSSTTSGTDSVHLVYYEGTAGDFKYATNKSGSWAKSTVETTNDVGSYNAVAVDSDGTVHTAYYDTTAGKIYYRNKASSGSSWSAAEQVAAAAAQVYISMGMYSNSIVHIGYGNNSDMRHIRRQNSTWGSAVVIGNAFNTSATSIDAIAVESGGRVQACYPYTGTSCNRENASLGSYPADATVLSNHTLPSDLDMILDSSDNTIAVTGKGSDGVVYYAVKSSGGAWGSEGTVASGLTTVNRFLSLAPTSSTTISLAMKTSNSTIGLVSGTRSGTSITWGNVSTIATDGNFVYGIRMRADTQGYLHLVYYSTASGSAYIYYMTNKSGSWSTPVLIDTVGAPSSNTRHIEMAIQGARGRNDK